MCGVFKLKKKTSQTEIEKLLEKLVEVVVLVVVFAL
jgi:hypothetical protein